MNRRTSTTMVLLGLVIVALPQASFAQSNPFPGTWQLNVAKSKFAGPPPKSLTLNVQAEGRGLKFTFVGVDAEGNPINDTVTAVFDGMPHPADNPNFDARAAARVDASTIITSATKAGRLVETQTGAVSSDGKTQTLTTTGINANGQPITSIAVYDKRCCGYQ